MILKKDDGTYSVERPNYLFDEAEEVRHYDKKFGSGNWSWCDRICSSLEPHCGYGEPLDKSTCGSCDGKCMRPTVDNFADYRAESMDQADGNWNKPKYFYPPFPDKEPD